ncbi:DNA-directed RNA polymerase sigma-70 factor [Amycolatopsis deserti]|uniref:DNA-directed RNA polymerase sigma-70 factor n=1 Tax=Amycolatopsis deserti TaxID=185696 RepID=A0ABQ3JGV6_9PSEU|nr:RNA polymerase sigma factor [Amycolatopsis deserti]GHF30487.1 DNA-directed RNA polymerase sigma-70 factor [Amycolatopsis deserti]
MTFASARTESDAGIIERSWFDADAFALIFDRHAATVHRFLARRVGGELADDLTGQTMLVAFDKRRRFDVSQHSALPWLYGIATNLISRHRRTEARQYRALARTGHRAPEENHDDVVSARVSAAAQPLGQALARLSAPERDVLLLVAWEHLSYDEVALALDIPIGTVRSRLHRARTKMRTALSLEDNDE